MKAAFKLLLLVGLIVYLVFAFTRFTRRGSSEVCEVVKVTVADSAQAGFITQEEVCKILKAARIYPVGLPIDSVDSEAIEKALVRNTFIKEAVCYKAPGGRLNVLVSQRMPVLRVIADNGEDYYIDEEGFTMLPQGYEANLVVATGHIDKAFTKRHLVRLGQHIAADPFWNNQIEQINVTSEGEIELVPRVGNQTLFLGRPVNLQKKLENLRIFYKRVMPTVGWNKYSHINLEYENQVICTKAEAS